MRIPKYKAFYKPHNYIYHVTDMNFEGPDYILREVKLSNGIWLRSDKLDDIILIEQTPFTDKNEQEIYEGDTMKHEIDGYMHRFMPDSEKWKNRISDYHNIWGVEKIGNILLTQSL